jgi:hypothetical protein
MPDVNIFAKNFTHKKSLRCLFILMKSESGDIIENENCDCVVKMHQNMSGSYSNELH